MAEKYTLLGNFGTLMAHRFNTIVSTELCFRTRFFCTYRKGPSARKAKRFGLVARVFFAATLFLSAPGAAVAERIETDFFIEQRTVLNEPDFSVDQKISALRNLEFYCLRHRAFYGTWDCLDEVLNSFFSDPQIAAAADVSEEIAYTVKQYKMRANLYTDSDDANRIFVTQVKSDAQNNLILQMLHDLYSEGSEVRLDAIYAIFDRGFVRAYEYKSGDQSSLQPARDQFLYALGLLLSVDTKKHHPYTILSVLSTLAVSLDSVGEADLSSRLLRIVTPPLLELAAELDPYLYLQILGREADSIEMPPIFEPNQLMGQLQQLKEQPYGPDLLLKHSNLEMQLCITLGDMACAAELFRNSVLTDPPAAVSALRHWIRRFGPENTPFAADDLDALKLYLAEAVVQRDEDGSIDRDTIRLAIALVSDLHYLNIQWSDPMYGQGDVKDWVYLSAAAQEANGSNTRPHQGMSLLSEADRRALGHGLVNLEGKYQVDKSEVFELRNLDSQLELTQKGNENLILVLHLMLQRSIGSRAAETRMFANRGKNPSQASARKRATLRSNDLMMLLLRGAAALVDSVSEQHSSKKIQGSELDFGRLFLNKYEGRDDRTLFRNIGQDQFLHGGIEAYRQSLADHEAVVISVKAGMVISTMCIRKDTSQYATELVDSAEFRLHSRLLELALTATHPPNIELDSQFPFASAQYFYQKMFQGISGCLAKAKKIFYSSSLELTRFPPAVFVSSLPGKDLRQGLGTAPWLANQFIFNFLDSPDELLQRNRQQFTFRKKDLFLGVADSFGSVDEKAVSVFRGAAVTPGTTLPPLANVEREVSSIAKMVGDNNSTLLLREDANENSVKAELELGYSYASIATHALISGEVAGLTESAILLSEPDSTTGDGLLLASEIAELDVNAKYVSLSACNTATFNPNAFEESIQGLSNAFRWAGVSQVLSTQWPIETAIAEAINVSTFSKIIESSEPPSDALSESIKNVLADSTNPAYQHPRFWGAFKVTGVQIAERP